MGVGVAAAAAVVAEMGVEVGVGECSVAASEG